MEELTEKIKKDLSNIKEHINTPNRLIELFSFTEEELKNIIYDIKFSLENGLFGFKTTSVNFITQTLSPLQYDSRAMDSFENIIKRAKGLLIVIIIQRLIAAGTIKPNNKTENSVNTVTEQLDLPSIEKVMYFLNKAIKTNKDYINDPLVKKIIRYRKIYRDETLKMNTLTANVSEEKRIAIRKNFEANLKEYVVKIKKTYNEIIYLINKNEITPNEQNILLLYDFKPMESLYMLQIEASSKILSTLLFASNEKFKIREILLNLTLEQNNITDLITKELEEYSNIAPTDKDISTIDGTFVKHIIEYLEKKKNWLKINSK